MKTPIRTLTPEEFPESLSDLYNHPDFHPFPQSSDDWINDPDRMERCHEAAEHGVEGSTHAEVIQDWRDFLATLESEHRRELKNQDKDESEIEADLATFEETLERITDEIDSCEAWHENAGSLHSQIG